MFASIVSVAPSQLIAMTFSTLCLSSLLLLLPSLVSSSASQMPHVVLGNTARPFTFVPAIGLGTGPLPLQSKPLFTSIIGYKSQSKADNPASCRRLRHASQRVRDVSLPPMTNCNIMKSGTALIPSALTKRTRSSCTALPLPAAATTRTARCAP